MNTQPVKRVLLAGATGYIGRFVARELVDRGYASLAIVRPCTDTQRVRDIGAKGSEYVVAEVTDETDITAALAGQQFDAVISCLASRSGAPRDAWSVDYAANRNLLALARGQGAEHFVMLSAICVQRPRLQFQYAKLAFEKELQDSGITFSIVRPTAFFKSLAGQVERVKAGKPFLVFGDGNGTACKPIGEADLARFIVDCLQDPALHNKVLPVGGPGTAITPREQGKLLCRLAGKPESIRSVSPRLFDVALAVLAPLSRFIPALESKAEFARIGRYYATESMLLWDAAREVYDADATPCYGNETLEGFYSRVLLEGMSGQELGAHKLF